MWGGYDIGFYGWKGELTHVSNKKQFFSNVEPFFTQEMHSLLSSATFSHRIRYSRRTKHISYKMPSFEYRLFSTNNMVLQCGLINAFFSLHQCIDLSLYIQRKKKRNCVTLSGDISTSNFTYVSVKVNSNGSERAFIRIKINEPCTYVVNAKKICKYQVHSTATWKKFFLEWKFYK